MNKAKFCPKCGLTKPTKDFPVNKSAKGGLGHQCLDCQRQNTKEHYKKNKQQYLLKNKKKAEETNVFIASMKMKPCKDCNVQYPPCVMDFDHLDGKKICVSKMKTYSKDTILKEIAKCDLVCANCHRIRTWQRNQQ